MMELDFLGGSKITMTSKTLTVDDTEYVMDRYYKQGMKAYRQAVPNNCNPYRSGCKAHDQWDYGHVNESCGYHKPVDRCVVRLRTTYWSDKTGIHWKQSLTFLRRQCSGYNLLEEDTNCIGAEYVIPRITNLNQCKDGIYLVTVCNEARDWETGIVEDYDYMLVELNPLDNL